MRLSWATDESYSLDVSTNGQRNGTFIYGLIWILTATIYIVFINQRLSDANTLVQISARTVFGVRHALETLSQLTAISNGGGAANQYPRPLMINSVHIIDRPAYRHRGLMVDTARNFIPIVDLERTLNAMGASKLNVFHWHATDSQSFPLYLPSVPQMAKYMGF